MYSHTQTNPTLFNINYLFTTHPDNTHHKVPKNIAMLPRQTEAKVEPKSARNCSRNLFKNADGQPGSLSTIDLQSSAKRLCENSLNSRFVVKKESKIGYAELFIRNLRTI